MTYIVLLLSVVLGIVFVEVLSPLSDKKLRLFLTFSGAYLLAVVVFHLMPEVFTALDGKRIGGFVMLGLLIQLLLEFLTKGVEHGHVHRKGDMLSTSMFVGLWFHAFLEAMPLVHGAGHGHAHAHVHTELLYALALHKLPIAIILYAFLKKSGLATKKILLVMVLFASAAPMGTYLSSHVPILQEYYHEISAIVLGVLLHISTTILFESSSEHKFNYLRFATIISAVFVGYFVS